MIGYPRVSVIVPVYNVQDYVVRCIKSIQKQTMPDFELLLIDDGSTDSSGLLCDNVSRYDERIKVIHKKNGGLSDARNVGLDIAQGEYIFFVDSDDWIDEDTLELLLKTAVDEDADIVECGYRNVFLDHVEEESANTGEMVIGDGIYAIQCQLDWRYFKSVAWNKLYHKRIFADGKRYPVGRYHEDEFFTHRAFYDAQKLVYVDVSKYNYVRERAGSITGKVTSKILDGCYALRERVEFAKERELGQLVTHIKNMYCWILFDRVYRCIQAGVSDEKMSQFLEFLRKEQKEVMAWDIEERYKDLYRFLCKSEKLFVECCDSPEKFQIEKERLIEEEVGR
jgi:glycosyltransferase involved in cell wall biosynthesis